MWRKTTIFIPRGNRGFFIALTLLILFVFLFSSYSISWVRPYASVEISDRLKILIWNDECTRDWEFLKKAKTEIKDCPVTCDILGDNKMADSVDAILVLAVSKEKLPKRQTFEENQIRVFYRQESPEGYPVYAHPYPNDYNWTMTYRRDSDVQIPYGYFQELSPEEQRKARKRNYKVDFVQQKSRLVAWTASHCDTTSKREELVLELNKHISVDVYGKCQSIYSFPSPFSCNTGRFAANYKNCYAQLSQHYKFYLAFENSICVDYITEKFWEALKNEMVPIVYGGANYNELAPPGSFINALDFPSVKMLAMHLQYLDENPEEYLKYFEWKKNYAVFDVYNFCALCQKLTEHSEVREDGRRVIWRNYSRIYPDILNWLQHEPNKNDGGKPACRIIENIQDLKRTFFPGSLSKSELNWRPTQTNTAAQILVFWRPVYEFLSPKLLFYANFFVFCALHSFLVPLILPFVRL